MLSTYLLNLSKELWGKKWRIAIIWSLKGGPKRFKEIHKELPGCSVKILSQVLKELEKNQLVIRKQYNTIPVKVTYELNPDLESLNDALDYYYVQIAKYFYKNAQIHKIPQDRVIELENFLFSKK